MAAHQAETKRNVSGAQFALVLGGLVLLVVVVWLVFLSGGDSGAGTGTAAAVTEPAGATEGEGEAEEEPARAPAAKGRVETFEVFAAKDPFAPLVSDSARGGGGGGDGGGNGNVLGGTGGTQGGGETVGGHRVRVVDVFEGKGGKRRAQIQVDGTVFTVDEGETFADNFQLLSASGDCATMLFGDDQFTLCEGEEILK